MALARLFFFLDSPFVSISLNFCATHTHVFIDYFIPCFKFINKRIDLCRKNIGLQVCPVLTCILLTSGSAVNSKLLSLSAAAIRDIPKRTAKNLCNLAQNINQAQPLYLIRAATIALCLRTSPPLPLLLAQIPPVNLHLPRGGANNPVCNGTAFFFKMIGHQDI